MPERDGSGTARERCAEMGKNTGVVARRPDMEMATRKGNIPQIRVEYERDDESGGLGR